MNIMLDLETLGTRPGCKVLSIGAVVFGPEGLGAEFYSAIRRDFQSYLYEDPDTLKWWGEQPPHVRQQVFNPPSNTPFLGPALLSFGHWSTRLKGLANQEVLVWGNGAGFDQPILAAAYHAMDLPLPWDFYNERCYRTLKALKPECKLVRTGDHHNALDDAKSQAEHAVRLHQELGLWNTPAK